MSELVQNNSSHRDLLWHLLGTVSAVVLMASAPVAAIADETDMPTVWIDLGGQLERVDSQQAIFSPAFFEDSAPTILSPLVGSQRPSRYSIGGQGKLTLVPRESDWQFSASVRYGRSNASRHSHYQSAHETTATLGGQQVTVVGRPLHRFGDGQASADESHVLLDFMAGKEVGLGIFGGHGSSVVSAGVRFAQFTSSSEAVLHARPMYRSGPFVTKYFPASPSRNRHLHGAYFENNTAVIQSRRKTSAIGPALSWDASLPVVGNSSTMMATLDWGANAALLFGRQRARVHHQTTGGNFYDYPGGYYPSKLNGYANHPPDQNRSHSVIIPNVGGFAGVSFRYLSAKVSMGYRADFFFGAVDGGIDARKSQNTNFYGPFATISIGLGG